jgi:hypothetical protein
MKSEGKYTLMAFIALLLTAGAARGQNEMTATDQIWANYDPTWRLRKRWTFDVDTAIRIINSDQFLWQIRLHPTLEFSPWKWMDLTGGVWHIYTRQAETFDRFETRPVVGIRLKADIWRGLRLSNYFRLEYRVQRDLDTGETLTARRLRDRVQVMIPINHRRLSDDNTWYAIVDAEMFRQRDPNVNDGFNSRRRYRAGIGRRKNSAWDFQLLYVLQRSRESATSPFSPADHVISFGMIQRVK